MHIIIGYIFILSLMKILLPSSKRTNQIFVVVAGLGLFTISTLRNIDFGFDTKAYILKFNSLSTTSLGELWNNFSNNYGKDPFFYFVSKIIKDLGFNDRMWLAIIAAFFCLAIFKLIYNYSADPFISVVTLISLGYFFFSLTGLRQTIALGFVVLAYKYLRDRKLVVFLILIIIGALFHSTALIFLIAYPLAYMKVGLRQIVIIGVSLFLIIVFKDKVNAFLAFFLADSERYSSFLNSNSTLSLSGFFIQFIIFLFCLIYKKEVIKKNEKNITYYNLLFLGILFQALSLVIAEFFRMSMYFSIFSIILIPLVLKVDSNKYRNVLVYFYVLAALIAYIFWSQKFEDFIFLWQV